MARATTKQQLIEDASVKYQKLIDLINSIPLTHQEDTFDFEDRDRNIRDVLVHLYEWHQMVIRWYQKGKNNIPTDIPATGFNWRQLPALNKQIWASYQHVTLDEAKHMLDQSHKEVLKIIESETNEALFEVRGYYPWTNNNTLGTYFVSATSSHYDWAIKKIKQFKKQL